MKFIKGNSTRFIKHISGKTLLAFLAIMFTSTLLFGDWDGSDTNVHTMGRVGIGTNSPGYDLEVSSATGNTHIGIISKGDFYPVLRLRRRNGTTKINAGYQMYIDSDGNLPFCDIGEDGTNNDVRFAIMKNGTIRCFGIVMAPGYSCASDLRYKHNIEPIQNSLQKIMALNGVMYNWKTAEFKDKGFSKDRQIGLVAQDVEKVLPELVMTDDEGYKSVQYSKVTAVLVEAMKEMNVKTVALEQKSSQLEQENKMLKDRIAQLEKMSERIARIERRLDSRIAVR